MEHREALNDTPAGWDTGRENQVDLVDLFYLLWGHIWVILGCLAAGAAAALLITRFFITPLYEATSSLYVVSASNNSVVNLTDLQIGSQLTADYRELMRSRPLLEDVISRLSLEGMTVQDLEKQIRITNTSDTRILKVTASSPDPQQAADIANQLVSLAREYLPRIMETQEPNLVEEAVVPTRKASPSYLYNLVLGGILGAAVCCGVLVGRRLLNDTLVTPEDMARCFGVEPLATIPESGGGKGKKGPAAQKGGLMRELIIHNMPELPFAAAEALNQLRINLGFCGDQIRTIMMTSSVPNEGKSFLTIQLWRQMAQVGSSPVLLIDCDFRNSEMRRKYSIRSASGGKTDGRRPPPGRQSKHTRCNL